jgi:hypothetical protein
VLVVKRLSLAFDIRKLALSLSPAVFERFRQIAQYPSLCVLLIGLLGFAGCAVIGLLVGIPQPKIHDEYSYLLAADTFAHGRLTNPTHPMWEHFESMHIIHQPSYMSKYPPAQGIILAAGKIIGGHPIVGVWMSFGLMCAAICWMLYGWISPRWALFGGLLPVIHPTLGIAGYWAQSYWGGAIAATGGALVIGALRRIIRRPSIQDASLMGVGLALLANSRPYEGLIFSLPPGLLLLAWMMGRRAPSVGLVITRIVLPVVFILVLTGIAMGVYNSAVTGGAFRMPYQVHEETYGITPVFLWQDIGPEPIYRHQVIRDFHTNYTRSFYTFQHTVLGFIAMKAYYLFPWAINAASVFAIPMAAMFTVMVQWTLRNRWALFAFLTYAVFLGGIVLQTHTNLHHLAPITAVNYIFLLPAMRLLRWRDRRAGQIALWLVLFLGITLLTFSVYGKMKESDSSPWHMQRARILKQLEEQGGQHLIIVSYGPHHSFHDEWVYNQAAIDSSNVVWARNMDAPKNRKLLEYFKSRHVWLLEVGWDEPISKLKPYPPNDS